ncbi:hypothetical protein AcW2_007201 [Taiwanofungus camphoratus]|nr:hypothetical protein AcW2_007201 [Antrodia cinnamomea]
MATFDYVEIPPYATRLQSNTPNDDIRLAPKIVTSLPRPEHSPARLPSLSSPTTSQSISPSLNVPQLLLSSALQLPANVPATPRNMGKGGPRLTTTRDPLSIPIVTVNFRRFVSKSGPAWWLQDRTEEIVMWRKGWKYTAVWMAAYAFLCYFPRLVLLLPHTSILGILLATHPSIRHRTASDNDPEKLKDVPNPPPAQIGEGSVDWLANVQAIQNLMGFASDIHDFVLPVVPHLTHSTPYSPIILTFTLVSFILLIPIVNILPLRMTFLVFGLSPLFLTHPFTRLTLYPVVLTRVRPLIKSFRVQLTRAVDNDRLEDKHWQTEMREVELYENERWSPSASTSSSSEDIASLDAGWGKAYLKPGERKAWTRGRDGWSGVSDDGSGDVSNLTFSLSSGWLFVETEDWRPDLESTWIAPVGADDGGWVYTNDSWLDPHPVPLEEWRTGGMTRRRRWIRRIYFNPISSLTVDIYRTEDKSRQALMQPGLLPHEVYCVNSFHEH